MTNQIYHSTEGDAISWLQSHDFTQFDPLVVPRTPLVYALEERIRKVHVGSTIPIKPSIVMIDRIDKVKDESEGRRSSIQYAGRFQYYGLATPTELIFLGGGYVIPVAPAEGRIKQVRHQNCFTASLDHCRRYMPAQNVIEVYVRREEPITPRRESNPRQPLIQEATS